MNDDGRHERRVNIVQGEFYVTNDPALMVSTLLGSCVAACIRDPIAKVGGINHFLLPGNSSDARGADERIGVHLMELLVNGLLKAGARRERLEAKIFGGARMIGGLLDIGKSNVSFAERFLNNEGIAVKQGSIGGNRGRRIQYWPVSGRARQSFVNGPHALDIRPAPAVSPVTVNAGELELF